MGQERRIYAAQDVVRDGILELPSPTGATTPSSLLPPFSQVTDHLALKAIETSLAPTDHLTTSALLVGDVVVPPRLLPMPFEDATAFARVSETETESALVERVDVMNELSAGTRVVLVAGEGQSGVTLALLWILEQSYAADAGRFPIYVEFEPAAAGDAIGRARRSALLEAGVPHNITESLPVICAVDDVTPARSKTLLRLVRHVSDHPNDVFVIGCREDVHAPIGQAFEAAGLEVRRAFLAPFGRREIRQLVSKLVDEAPTGLVDVVLRMASAAHLPKTPFVLAALVVVLAQEEDVATLNVSTVLEAYVGLLLGRDEIGDTEDVGLDFRRREHLLGALAAKLLRDQVEFMPPLEADEFLVEYFKTKGWEATLSPARIMQNLIQRRILVEKAGGIGFRHPALRELFAGKWISEDTEFSDYALANVGQFGGAIRHAAALRRNRSDVLDAVATSVRLVVEEIASDVSLSIYDRVTDEQGWSKAPDIDELKNRMRASRPSEEEIDEMYDRVELHEAEEVDPLWEPIARLSDAISLLSDVLATSELIDDVDVKTALLREVVDYWARLTVILAIHEDETSLLGAMLQEILERTGKPEAVDLFRHILGVAMTLASGLAASRHLSNRALFGPLQQLMEDEDFMSSPLRALIATFLATQMRQPGWPRVLRRLYESHGQHPFVAQACRVWATVRYTDPATSPEDALALEDFLADMTVENVAGGPRAVQARARARTDAIQQLRSAKLLKETTSDTDVEQ